MTDEKLAALEKLLGYVFRDKMLAVTALTHSSYANEHRDRIPGILYNERLEFLGDSVLSLVASVHLFADGRHLPEGELTKIRAGIVCENALYDYATKLGLGDYLLLGRGEENSGGRTRKSILADATEAVIAAIYLDGGFEKARDFILPFLEEAADTLVEKGRTEDYKTLLQKFVQAVRGDVLAYTVTDERGPSHDRVFDVAVTLNNNVIGRGTGSSKREAEQEAARQALALFGELPKAKA